MNSDCFLIALYWNNLIIQAAIFMSNLEDKLKKKNKLFRLLSTLDEDQREFADFLQFVRSPYHNSNKRLIQLIAYLKPYHPDYNQPRCTKENAFRKVFGEGVDYDENRMNVLYSGLVKLFYKYLIIRGLERDEFRQQQFLCNALAYRNLEKEATSNFKKMHQQHVNERKKTGTSQFLQHYEVLVQGMHKFGQFETANFEEIIHILEQFLLHEKLRLAVAFQNNRRILKPSKTFFTHVELLTLASAEHSDFMLNLWSKLLQLLKGGDENLFFIIKKQFTQHINDIDIENQEVILVSLLNVAFQCIREEQTEYYEYIYDLYVLGLKNKVFTYKGYIDELTFTNISIIFFKVKTEQRMFRFFEDFKQYLRVEKVEETLQLCHVLAAFSKAKTTKSEKDYDRCIIIALEADRNLSNTLAILRNQLILLRAFFEVKIIRGREEEFMLYRVGALQQRIKRHKLGVEKKESYLNFIAFCKKIIEKLSEPNRKEIFQTLEEKIQKTPNVFQKSWLIEKIGELI